ncbi:hypothetical protein BsWGS_09334 [Bradybaena similaris]
MSAAVAAVSTDSMDFRLVADDRVTLDPLGDSWMSHSQLACAAACLRSSPLCTGFLFHKHSKFCTLGKMVAATDRSRDTANELLYSDASCPENFTLFTTGNGSICYWISPDDGIYQDADKSCRGDCCSYTVFNNVVICVEASTIYLPREQF